MTHIKPIQTLIEEIDSLILEKDQEIERIRNAIDRAQTHAKSEFNRGKAEGIKLAISIVKSQLNDSKLSDIESKALIVTCKNIQHLLSEIESRG